MKSSKKAKNALLVSVVSIALCVALLIGATFAWFTDSATNSGNSITAGTLDVELTPGDNKPLFSSEKTQWEPGYSQKNTVTVSNAGNLWLQYSLNFADVTVKGSEKYPDADITKVLDVYKVEGSSEDVKAKDLSKENYLGTMADLMQAGTGQGGKLAPKGGDNSSETFTLVIKMKESADNKYMGASVSFSVKVAATQASEETDGFGSSDYDQDAVEELPDVYVSDATQLQNAVANAQNGDIVAMAAGTYACDLTIDKDLTLLGDANTVFEGKIKTEAAADGTKPDLTIDEVHFATGSTLSETGLNVLTMENCTVEVGEKKFINTTDESNGNRSIKLVLVGNKFVSTVSDDVNSDPIFTWGSIADGSVIKDNVFGSETNTVCNWAFRVMNIDNGATVTVANNTVYSLGNWAFAFGNNADRETGTHYTIVFEDNTTFVKYPLGFLNITQENHVANDVQGTLIFKGTNTINGTAITKENYTQYIDSKKPNETNVELPTAYTVEFQ